MAFLNKVLKIWDKKGQYEMVLCILFVSAQTITNIQANHFVSDMSCLK